MPCTIQQPACGTDIHCPQSLASLRAGKTTLVAASCGGARHKRHRCGQTVLWWGFRPILQKFQIIPSGKTREGSVQKHAKRKPILLFGAVHPRSHRSNSIPRLSGSSKVSLDETLRLRSPWNYKQISVGAMYFERCHNRTLVRSDFHGRCCSCSRHLCDKHKQESTNTQTQTQTQTHTQRTWGSGVGAPITK